MIDANETLAKARSLAGDIRAAFDADEDVASAEADELAGLVLALDAHLAMGGALPREWVHVRPALRPKDPTR